jgi:Mg2+-importing ATPase
VLILLFAVLVAVVAGDLADGLIILAIVVLSGLLGFWQEHRAGRAVQRLLALVQVHANVRRDGAVVEVPPAEVVPGDVVVLGAGDIIPCDCRLLNGDDLQVDDAALTGETFPRHKHPDPAPADAPLAERLSALLLGSHVVSGRGEAVAVATGAGTELWRLSHRLEQTAPIGPCLWVLAPGADPIRAVGEACQAHLVGRDVQGQLGARWNPSSPSRGELVSSCCGARWIPIPHRPR